MEKVFSEYSYDIFISYRHNDNKFEGWVSNFVKNLQKELQATVKYPLRIYFDENPEDGLGATHIVEDSLNNKIKSLIFIPIVSQTYCDTESYAWKKEFLTFKREISQDEIGPRVQLRNGNVVSRILPIKIHDIEVNDIRLLERELDGYLRSIDFIYKEGGINRPLREQDDALFSGNYHILYRNQINLVANAIKDIVLAVKEKNQSTEIPRPVIQREITPVEIPGLDEINSERKKIFLAWTSFDLKEKREELAISLDSAGFDVIPSMDCPIDDDTFKTVVEDNLKIADFSLHLFSGEYGRRFEADDEISFPRYQYEYAKKLSLEKSSKIFIWYTPDASEVIKPAQKRFIDDMRQNISKGTMFTNSPNTIQLIDDLRAATVEKKEVNLDRKETDIFFIYNENDEFEANLITDSISDKYPLEILNVLSDGREEYTEITKQQIPKSKLAVIYFKYTADWAVPFTKQIWKEIGGANSPTTLMLIGEDDPKSNLSRKFKAPKVLCSVVPGDTLSEEVLKAFEKFKVS